MVCTVKVVSNGGRADRKGAWTLQKEPTMSDGGWEGRKSCRVGGSYSRRVGGS